MWFLTLTHYKFFPTYFKHLLVWYCVKQIGGAFSYSCPHIKRVGSVWAKLHGRQSVVRIVGSLSPYTVSFSYIVLFSKLNLTDCIKSFCEQRELYGSSFNLGVTESTWADDLRSIWVPYNFVDLQLCLCIIVRTGVGGHRSIKTRFSVVSNSSSVPLSTKTSANLSVYSFIVFPVPVEMKCRSHMVQHYTGHDRMNYCSLFMLTIPYARRETSIF